MATNDEIDNKLEELDIIKAIENKDVPYVITQIKGLIDETDKEARADERANIEARNKIHEKYHELNDKDIEINTAKALCGKFDEIIPYHDDWTVGEWTDYNDEEYDAVKKEFGVD